MESYTGQALNLQDVRIVDTLDPLGYKDINAPGSSTTVTIRDASGLAISSIFSDNSGTAQVNPYNTDSEGGFTFYAANGRYNVVINEGLPTEFTIFDVGLFDINDSVNMDNVNVSKLDNPLFRGFVKNKLTDTINPATSITTTRGTTATSIDVNGVLRIAAIDTPREEASGWLFESASENLFADRRTLNWGNTRTVTSTDSTKAVDGTSDATKVTVDSTLSATHSINSTANISVTSGETYSKSVFAKAGNGTGAGRYVLLETDNFSSWSNDGHVVFDLVLGSVQGGSGIVFTSGQYSIKDIGNGWYRCAIQMVCTLTSSVSQEVQMSDGSAGTTFDGNGTDFIYLDWAQAEESVFPTSPINSLVSTVTRSADDISLQASGNKTFSTYSVFARVTLDSFEGNGAGADSRKHIYAVQGLLDSLYFDTVSNRFVAFGGGNAADAQTDVVTDATNTIAVVRTPTLISIYLNGVLQPNTGTVIDFASFDVDTKSIFVGSLDGTQRFLDGNIQDLRFYQEPLTLDEIRYLGS